MIQAIAREQLAIEHLGAVKAIASQIQRRLPKSVAFEDLYGAGVIGLMDALERYDPAKEIKFSSFAGFRIRGAILDSLRQMDPVPRWVRSGMRNVSAARHELAGELLRKPEDVEVSRRLGISFAALRELQEKAATASVSLDAPEEEDTFHLPTRPADDPLFLYLQAETKDVLIRAIADLPARERLVVMLYYYDEVTMREIGLMMGVVESRVSQLHAAAIRRLRDRLARTKVA